MSAPSSDNPYTTTSERGWVEIKLSAVLFAVTSICVALRFIARRVLGARLGLCDLFTGISWVLLLALVVQLFLWASIGGNGQHMADLNPAQLQTFFQIFYANQVTYFVLSPCLKLSLVFFYRRIFSVREFTLAADIVAGIIIAWGIAITIAGIFQCTPISSFWGPKGSGVCINEQAFLYGVQGPNIVFDFAILLMPVPVIWKIQRPTKDKLALLGVFTLGGLGCISGIVRIVALGAIDENDVTYTIYSPTCWTVVEPCLTLVCGSLPVIRGLLNRRRSSRGRSSSNGINSSRSGHNHFATHGYAARDRLSKRHTHRPAVLDDQGNELGPYKVMVSQEISVTSEPAATISSSDNLSDHDPGLRHAKHSYEDSTWRAERGQ